MSAFGSEESQNPMRRPLPKLGTYVTRAVIFGVLVGLAVVVAYIAITTGFALRNGIAVDFSSLLARGIVWWGINFAILTFGYLVWHHRPLQDRSFTIVGFLTTFFALAMLVIFFAELGRQAVDWFKVVPTMVHARNDFLDKRVTDAVATREKVEKQIRREMEIDLKSAANDKEREEIRKEYETDILPNKLEDLTTTEKDFVKERDLGKRTATDPVSMLSYFLGNGPSSEPQDVGVWPALVGSLLVVLVTFLVAVPMGVGAAIYLEEYKRGGNRFTRSLQSIIQVNINNLAGVPSVVYGILGAAVFVDAIFHPLELSYPWIAARNTLGGGLTLALLTLPVVIVASQEAIRAVPDSIRQGAYALGATHWQTIWHQVLPMAMPGILTGTILSLSRAIGEAAPLVLFGALLFVDQTPEFLSRFTVMPMQIFGWSDRPRVTLEDGSTVAIWQANAAVASIVLLVVLLSMNGAAIYFRNRAQSKMRG